MTRRSATPSPRPSWARRQSVERATGNAGTIEFDYVDQAFTLEAGDSAYFDASVSHQIRAVGAARAEVVVVAHTEPGSALA
ncbi:cupin domain-containing protein [Mycobacterium sp. 1165178.9]|uniref:cupin domain-containing protein n=1 Tax=Mycobacterium sp. 1165178.9 TaxID=1834070 RepID=UPI0008007D28|nr:hypothetical protein A5652_25850 [Mycobacterium sp. 1165178.9]